MEKIKKKREESNKKIGTLLIFLLNNIFLIANEVKIWNICWRKKNEKRKTLNKINKLLFFNIIFGANEKWKYQKPKEK